METNPNGDGSDEAKSAEGVPALKASNGCEDASDAPSSSGLPVGSAGVFRSAAYRTLLAACIKGEQSWLLSALQCDEPSQQGTPLPASQGQAPMWDEWTIQTATKTPISPGAIVSFPSFSNTYPEEPGTEKKRGKTPPLSQVEALQMVSAGSLGALQVLQMVAEGGRLDASIGSGRAITVIKAERVSENGTIAVEEGRKGRDRSSPERKDTHEGEGEEEYGDEGFVEDDLPEKLAERKEELNPDENEKAQEGEGDAEQSGPPENPPEKLATQGKECKEELNPDENTTQEPKAEAEAQDGEGDAEQSASVAAPQPSQHLDETPAANPGLQHEYDEGFVEHNTAAGGLPENPSEKLAEQNELNQDENPTQPNAEAEAQDGEGDAEQSGPPENPPEKLTSQDEECKEKLNPDENTHESRTEEDYEGDAEDATHTPEPTHTLPTLSNEAQHHHHSHQHDPHTPHAQHPTPSDTPNGHTVHNAFNASVDSKPRNISNSDNPLQEGDKDTQEQQREEEEQALPQPDTAGKQDSEHHHPDSLIQDQLHHPTPPQQRRPGGYSERNNPQQKQPKPPKQHTPKQPAAPQQRRRRSSHTASEPKHNAKPRPKAHPKRSKKHPSPRPPSSALTTLLLSADPASLGLEVLRAALRPTTPLRVVSTADPSMRELAFLASLLHTTPPPPSPVPQEAGLSGAPEGLVHAEEDYFGVLEDYLGLKEGNVENIAARSAMAKKKARYAEHEARRQKNRKKSNNKPRSGYSTDQSSVPSYSRHASSFITATKCVIPTNSKSSPILFHGAFDDDSESGSLIMYDGRNTLVDLNSYSNLQEHHLKGSRLSGVSPEGSPRSIEMHSELSNSIYSEDPVESVKVQLEGGTMKEPPMEYERRLLPHPPKKRKKKKGSGGKGGGGGILPPLSRGFAVSCGVGDKSRGKRRSVEHTKVEPFKQLLHHTVSSMLLYSTPAAKRLPVKLPSLGHLGRDSTKDNAKRRELKWTVELSC